MVKVSEQTWNDLSDYRESLEHHGVKGMKWGIRKERETTGRHRAENKTRTFSEKVSQRRAKRARDRVLRAKAKSEKQQREAEKKAAKQKMQKEKKRNDILNDPTRLYKHRREFTADEIQTAMKQFEWEQKLSNLSAQRLKNGADFINTMFSYGNNAINLYNTAARVVNSVDEDSTLPIIKTSKDILDDKKKKKDSSNKKQS